MEIPKGHAGLVLSKSGLNFNHDITCDGVIDIGYTGTVKVKLYNHGDTDYRVSIGDKIAQLVVVSIVIPYLMPVEELEETERGDDGFGSTGR